MKFGKLTARLAIRRFWLWLITCLVLAVVVFVAGMRVYWRVQLNREIARIKAEGYPTTFEELNEFYPAVPDEDNMALILTNAFAQMDVDVPDNEEALVPFFGLRTVPSVDARLSAAEIEASIALLERNKGALQLLRDATRLEKSKYPIRLGPNQPEPHLGKLRSAIKLLALEAVVKLSTEDLDGASSAVVTMFQIARSTDAAPGFSKQNVGVLLRTMALITLENFTATAEIPQNRLSPLRASVQAAMKGDPLGDMLVGMRVAGIRTATDVAELETAVFLTLDLDEWFGGSPASLRDELQTEVQFFLHRMGGFRNRDLLNFLRTFRQWLRESHPGAPYPASIRTDRRSGVLVPDYLEDMILSPTERFVAKLNNTYRRLTAADTALAVELFRRETGTLPDSLAALIPKLLNAVPTDYESGQPMRILGTTNGFGVGTTTPLFQVRTNFTEPSHSPVPSVTSAP